MRAWGTTLVLALSGTLFATGMPGCGAIPATRVARYACPSTDHESRQNRRRGTTGRIHEDGSRRRRSASDAEGAASREHAHASATALHGKDAPTIVITVDGVRWQEIFQGTDPERLTTSSRVRPMNARQLLPNVYRWFFDRGIALGDEAKPVFASGPAYLSLPGYREMFSGHPSSCQNNACEWSEETTVVDELIEHEGLAPEDVAIVTSWGPMAHAITSHPCGAVISAGRTGGASREAFRVNRRAAEILRAASVASAYPGWGDYRPDRFTAALALHYLREVAPRFLVIGLGDTDEYAHRDNYERYIESIQMFDAFIGDLFRILDRMGDRGGHEASVFVLTDHGRNVGFTHHGSGDGASSRVWLLAHGSRILGTNERASGSAPMRLGDLAPTLRAALRLPAHDEFELARSFVTFDDSRDLLAHLKELQSINKRRDPSQE
ncbi:MAG: hypothetical protein IPK13_02590 [Deltaproteobacteria bacterium]|nr:hypothetical protein [Deltaproteobacteria bacterium]